MGCGAGDLLSCCTPAHPLQTPSIDPKAWKFDVVDKKDATKKAKDTGVGHNDDGTGVG